MIKIKVPFRFGFIFFEKSLWFSFGLGSLEYSTKHLLKCELHEIDQKSPIDINIAILYGGYIQACRERYRRPIYSLDHARFWMQHLSNESSEQFIKIIKDLLGELSGMGSGIKKK